METGTGNETIRNELLEAVGQGLFGNRGVIPPCTEPNVDMCGRETSVCSVTTAKLHGEC